MDTFIELAAARRSVRRYSSRVIEPDILANILEAGRVAPTACNNQPQRIKEVSEAEELAKVDGCTPCRFGAPTVLLVCYDKTISWKRPFDGACSGEVDASIVTTHMMLAAHGLGLGTCWVMYFDPAKASKLFSLPENIVPVAMLPMGYPAEGSLPSDNHCSRMDIDKMLLN
jgi:nitroreductase